jgi:hypothetical protein
MVRAALALYEAGGDPAYLERAEAWIAAAERDFSDPAGRWLLAPAAADLPFPASNALDGPTPSALGTLALESARLWVLTGQTRHRERAEAILARVGGEARRHPFAHATLLSAALLLARPIQIVVSGDAGDPAVDRLLAVAAARPLPGRVLLVRGPGRALPDAHPAAEAASLPGRAVAQVCIGPTCLAPALGPADLEERLDEASRTHPRW